MSFLTDIWRVDALAGFVALFIGVFGVLTIVYSVGYMRKHPRPVAYYIYVVLTCAFSLATVMVDHLVTFLVLWGILGILLYLLIACGTTQRTPATAQKAFLIVGGSDAVMLLGAALVWHLAGRPDIMQMRLSALSLPLVGAVGIVAYLCLASGALAKAGCMPFHTWVPDTAEDAPIPVTAFLPASLDKLLGIYFLARLSLDIFRMTPTMNSILMGLGSITILAAVMMALVQHDLKRLLGYHAVSQVGYMVLGIGTGTPIGIAGGLFHMLNHTLYKSCLFFAGGAVEQQAGTTDLRRLGALGRTMPITFGAFAVAALAISGVPPLNGFASKWMVYQGILESGRAGGGAWVLWLTAAMFGSALTLASFLKAAHAVFLGQPAVERAGSPVRETGPSMWIPCAILAVTCIVFGLFPYAIPLETFIYPVLDAPPEFVGLWQPGAAVLMLALGFLAGSGLYLVGTARRARTVEPFVGGEKLEDHPEMRLSGKEFYGTVQEMAGLKWIYQVAERRGFDTYEWGLKLTAWAGKPLCALHDGVLPRYLAWCLLGFLVLMLAIMG